MSFVRNLSKKYEKQVLDTAIKTWLDAIQTAFEKLVHKVAEATGELIGKKINDKIVKPKSVIDENSKNLEKIVIPAEKREKILNELRVVL